MIQQIDSEIANNILDEIETRFKESDVPYAYADILLKEVIHVICNYSVKGHFK